MGLWQRTSALGAGLVLLGGCAHPAGTPAAARPCPACPACEAPLRDAALGPRGALDQFLKAAERGDFEAVYRLLASPLRARYTPARLASDFSAVRGLAQDKLARLRACPQSAWRVAADQAFLPVGDGKSARLVREPDGWRLAALE